MANIHDSKEIYRKLSKYDPNNIHGRDVIIPIHGLYVTGPWLTLLFQEPGVRITDITLNHATVVDYTDREDSLRGDEGTFGLLEYDVDVTTDFVWMGENDESIYTEPEEGTFGLLEYEVNVETTYTWFGDNTEEIYTEPEEGTFGLLEYVVNVNTDYHFITTHGNDVPEPMIRITDITVTAADVT